MQQHQLQLRYKWLRLQNIRLHFTKNDLQGGVHFDGDLAEYARKFEVEVNNQYLDDVSLHGNVPTHVLEECR